MMPPLLADIQSDHSIFDMCAAPGSKTAQALELIQLHHQKTNGQLNTTAAKGLVIANDADQKRAYLLTHQLNRLNTANTLVINHQA
jgi:multisite-specific tRNA:(cytosine-C5)-methyltransferase